MHVSIIVLFCILLLVTLFLSQFLHTLLCLESFLSPVNISYLLPPACGLCTHVSFLSVVVVFCPFLSSCLFYLTMWKGYNGLLSDVLGPVSFVRILSLVSCSPQQTCQGSFCACWRTELLQSIQREAAASLFLSRLVYTSFLFLFIRCRSNVLRSSLLSLKFHLHMFRSHFCLSSPPSTPSQSPPCTLPTLKCSLPGSCWLGI